MNDRRGIFLSGMNFSRRLFDFPTAVRIEIARKAAIESQSVDDVGGEIQELTIFLLLKPAPYVNGVVERLSDESIADGKSRRGISL